MIDTIFVVRVAYDEQDFEKSIENGDDITEHYDTLEHALNGAFDLGLTCCGKDFYAVITESGKDETGRFHKTIREIIIKQISNDL